MNRLLVIAVTALATLALTAGAALTVFSVLPAADGDGFLLVSRKQAKECAEGGGCSAWSDRQLSLVLMRMIQEYAKQSQKGRSDI